jgi:hypothetical protein
MLRIPFLSFGKLRTAWEHTTPPRGAPVKLNGHRS